MIRKHLGTLLIKYEEWQIDVREKPTFMASLCTQEDGYIGSIDSLTKFILENGIIPEGEKDFKVCSYGKSVKDGKWYGWSHRAIHGFQIGDEVKEGDCCASSGYTDDYLKEHPEENKALPIGFIAKTEEDSKKMAIAFAESVG